MQFDTIPRPSEQSIPNALNLFKIIFLLSMLFGSFAVTQIGVEAIERVGAMTPATIFVLKWSWVGLMALLTSVSITGLGILAHDAVHKVMFSSQFWNEALGGFISAMALLPFQSNRQFHLTHHGHAHQPGKDPENLMHNHNFYVALILGAIIALTVHYRIWLVNLFTHLFNRRYTGRIMLDGLFFAVAVGIYFYLVPALGMELKYTFLPFLAVLPVMFSWRAMSDHYGLPAVNRDIAKTKPVDQAAIDEWHKDNPPIQQEVTGWVVLTHPLLEWLWSNVNYHEVHHKYPYLSYIYLKQIFALTRGQLPYAVAKGYTRSLLRQRNRQYYEPAMPASDPV